MNNRHDYVDALMTLINWWATAWRFAWVLFRRFHERLMLIVVWFRLHESRYGVAITFLRKEEGKDWEEHFEFLASSSSRTSVCDVLVCSVHCKYVIWKQVPMWTFLVQRFFLACIMFCILFRRYHTFSHRLSEGWNPLRFSGWKD